MNKLNVQSTEKISEMDSSLVLYRKAILEVFGKISQKHTRKSAVTV